MVALGLL